MKIKGFQGTSLLDFPGRIASLIFFGGCNLSCPFCHNSTLVLDPEQYPDYPLEDLLAELCERRNFIDGVVVSGGEPTLDRDLPLLLREVKALGLEVKLDSNGLAPAVLERLLAEGLVDYLALDLKTAPERYGELHRAPVDPDALRRSISVLLASTVPYEIRTTCVPKLVEEPDFSPMGKAIVGARHWVLQQYIPRYALAEEWRAIRPHSPERLAEFARVAEGYVERVSLRGL
ncbi:anaerobic ribonucleoside-triphosphate reductase activating protein [Trichloromonas sp.]|uniref:anaerobic ribonucleoside-triphosphate reductase activating protein n=1 Tax=Trichloromonas sp. TaxID=3069249 RepID=UPI002A4C7B23|nr:anaerobic ribonucleoside-triphosphate reductase activating protein [Trichloromonas sp.]